MKKQHKEGTCKVLGRSFVFSAFYADFLSLPQISDYHHLKIVLLNNLGFKVLMVNSEIKHAFKYEKRQ